MAQNRKGAMPLAMVVILVILGAFLFIFISGIYTEKGPLKQAAGAVDQAASAVPGLEDPTLNKMNVPVPEKVGKAYYELTKVLNRDYTNAPCIVRYGENGLSNLEGYTVIFSEQTEPGARFLAQLIRPDGRIVRDSTYFINPELCVVGGTLKSVLLTGADGNFIATVDETGKVTPIGINTDKAQIFNDLKKALGFADQDFSLAARNFYANWILDLSDQLARKNQKKIISIDYTLPSRLLLKKDGSIEAKIGSEILSAGKDDGGLLYVPEKGKVCVFATYKDRLDVFGVCDASATGMDDDCIAEIKIDTCAPTTNS